MSYDFYTMATYEELHEAGRLRGRNVASWVDIPEVGAVVHWPDESPEPVQLIDGSMVADYVHGVAFNAECEDRCFTPFEFTASAINKRDDADEAWEAYNAGIAAGICENFAERLPAHIGTTEA